MTAPLFLCIRQMIRPARHINSPTTCEVVIPVIPLVAAWDNPGNQEPVLSGKETDTPTPRASPRYSSTKIRDSGSMTNIKATTSP